MDHKATHDTLRKNSINFKCQRAQLPWQKLNLDGKKQAKEGNTYQSGTGLNLDPNNSTKLIQEFNIINLKISSEELKNFETCTPKLTTTPVADKFSMTETKVTISSFMILKQTRLEKAQKYVNFQWLINQVCTVSTTIYCH